MTLDEVRAQIDAIDKNLLKLLVQRAECVREVGRIKRETGAEFYAPEREEELLRRLVSEAQGALPEKSIRAIYREIMSASLALEKDLCIAYLGPEGTWTHEAARKKFGCSVRYSPQPSVADVFDEVERGRADYGVVPVENSTEGAVNHTLDEFLESALKICAQIHLRIEHNLVSKFALHEIRQVYSHPQSFGQCRQWLRVHLPHAELVETSSNARAVQLAAETPAAAAIAGVLAADLHHLPVLESSIQDDPSNTTRFLVIGKKASPPTGCDRTSILFTVKDEAGALLRALEPFMAANLSLSKIESRPSKRKAWEYVFFIDVEGHSEDSRLRKALENLACHATHIKILGSYPASHNGE